MRPTGVIKRPPSYAPLIVRDLLMSMSKADLAELVADYLIRTVGENEARDSPVLLKTELIETANAIRLSQNRKPLTELPGMKGTEKWKTKKS